MKRLILLLCLFVLGSAMAQPAAVHDFQSKYAEWEKNAYADIPSAKQIIESFSTLKTAWAMAPEQLRRAKADVYTSAALRTAEFSLDGGSNIVPAELLQEAGRIAETYSLELGRGRSFTAFERTVSTQARVVAKINWDPLEGAPLGYEFGELSNGYYAIQKSLESERETSSASQYPIENLRPDESAGTLLRMDSNGMVLDKMPVVIVDGSGSLKSRVKAILRYEPAGPDGPGRFARHDPESYLTTPDSSDSSSTMEQRTVPASNRVEETTHQPKTSPMPAMAQTESFPVVQTEPSKTTPWPWIVVPILLLAVAGGVLFKCLRK